MTKDTIAHGSECSQQPEQLKLDFTDDRWPRRPYCSDDPSNEGVRIRSLDCAARKAYIQPNHPTVLWRIPFDIDREGAVLDWSDRGAPPPSWAIQNPVSGHAHLIYEIEVPVLRDDDTPALRLAAAVEHGLGTVLEADPSYRGVLVHTPRHSRWRTFTWREQHYPLWELADWLPDAVNDPKWRDRRRKPPEDFALGRNVALFHTLRKWAYSAIRRYWEPGGEARWREACERRASELNAEFAAPLDPLEVRHVAKSVARWTWRRMSPAGFQRWCEAQGRKGGVRSGEVRRRGSEAERRPWEAIGVSRATYYRRKRRGDL